MSAPTKEQVLEVLRRYGVRTHYEDSSRARVVRYAVWARTGAATGQVTDSTSHKEAKEAADLLDLFAGGAA